MKLGYIQNAPIFGDKARNFARVGELAAGVQADLLVLPELFASGYAFESVEEARALAEEVGGPTTQFLCELSALTGATVVAGFPELAGDKVFNSALMVRAEKVVDCYRKLHLFNKEKSWFSPGDKPLAVQDVGGIKIGMMICFDWIFPEVARTLALAGAEVLAHPCNLVLPYCQRAMTTRCIENRVFAVTANRIGRERRRDDFTFTGQSQITGTDSSVLAAAPADAEEARVIEVDLALSHKKTVNDFNHVLNDRRVEFYR